VTRDQLFAQLSELHPDVGDVVYVDRRADDYGASIRGLPIGEVTEAAPEAWMYYSGRWPETAEQFPQFFEELLAEMESMVGGADRCRWPLDEPWPHVH
jgi:hypothetical protein